MNVRTLDGLRAEQANAGQPYLEFLRSGAMSVGLYALDVGQVDHQQPHAEDEIYVVMSGRARFSAGDETRDAAAGDVIYVAAGVAHHFHDISARIELIVVFAPPET